jgi:hypothetical protein
MIKKIIIICLFLLLLGCEPNNNKKIKIAEYLETTDAYWRGSIYGTDNFGVRKIIIDYFDRKDKKAKTIKFYSKDVVLFLNSTNTNVKNFGKKLRIYFKDEK